jgi:hypothetical protein
MGRQQLIEKIINSIDIEKYQSTDRMYWCHIFHDFQELWSDKVMNYHIKLLAKEFLVVTNYSVSISVNNDYDILFGGSFNYSFGKSIRISFYNWLKSELNV